MYWNINQRGNSDFFYCDYILTYYLRAGINRALTHTHPHLPTPTHTHPHPAKKGHTLHTHPHPANKRSFSPTLTKTQIRKVTPS